MKRNTLTYIVLSLFILCIIFLSIKNSGKYREIKENGKSSVGQISTLGSDILISYESNGEMKQKRMSEPFTTMYTGEKYTVLYLDKYPDKAYVDFTKPVFDTTYFSLTKCLLIEQSSKTSKTVRVRYQVAGKDYKRILKFPAFKENESKNDYSVLFKSDEPKIAYIKKKL